MPDNNIDDAPVTIRCPESLDISIVRMLYDELSAALGTNQAIVLDGSGVERADTAGLQLLCALFKDDGVRAAGLRWEQPNEVVQLAARQLGLSACLELEQQ